MVLMIEHPPQGTVCADCGAGFRQRVIEGTGEVGFACDRDPEHIGYKSSADLAMLKDRALAISPYTGPRQALANRSPIFAGAKDVVILARLMNRSGLNEYQAAAFFLHAKQLDLDPFLGQIAALTFKEGDEPSSSGSKTLEIMITEKGWAALAHRTEPDEFVGNPRVSPMTKEEKVDYGWEAEDVAYWASGKKRSWDEPSVICARVSQEEIDNGNKGRGATPLAKDPHHHCRQRVTRRWYQENFPDAAALASREDIEITSVEVQRIIEGTGSLLALTAGPDGKVAEPEGLRPDGTADPQDRANWMTLCPMHGGGAGVEWFKKGRMRSYGHKHNGGWCNRPDVIRKIVFDKIESMARQGNHGAQHVNDWLKSQFGTTRSKLTEEQCMEALDAYISMVDALKPEPEPATDTPEQQVGEELATGPTTPATKRSDEDREREEAMSREMDEQLGEGGADDK